MSRHPSNVAPHCSESPGTNANPEQGTSSSSASGYWKHSSEVDKDLWQEWDNNVYLPFSSLPYKRSRDGTAVHLSEEQDQGVSHPDSVPKKRRRQVVDALDKPGPSTSKPKAKRKRTQHPVYDTHPSWRISKPNPPQTNPTHCDLGTTNQAFPVGSELSWFPHTTVPERLDVPRDIPISPDTSSAHPFERHATHPPYERARSPVAEQLAEGHCLAKGNSLVWDGRQSSPIYSTFSMSSYMSPNGHLHTSPMTLSQCFLRRSPASTSSYGDTPAPRSVNYQSPLVSETVDDVGYPAFASPTRPLVESRSLEPPWSPTDIQKILDGNWDNDSFLEGLFAGIANESYSEVDFGPLAHGLGTSEVPSDSGLDDSWSVNDTGGELRPVRDSPSPAPPAATCGAQCREGTWARPNALDALALTPHSNDAHASASHDASFRPAPASLSPAQVEHSPHKPCNSPMTPSSLFSHSPSAATSRVCSPDKARTPGKRALVFVEEYREEGMKGSRTVVDLDLYQPITATGMSPESSQAGESDLTGAEARPTATKSPVTTQPDEKSKISKDESQDESQ